MSAADWMREALRQAGLAATLDEVPVGAVVVLDGRIVGAGHNRTVIDRDPTAHAEIVSLRDAARAVGNHRLVGAVLVTTLEPCLMCCGAAVQARVKQLVWAADDPKAGALAALRAETDAGRLNHRIDLEPGPCAAESAEMLKAFFRARRGKGDIPIFPTPESPSDGA
jgi:tRNA(adenine34) deaminase